MFDSHHPLQTNQAVGRAREGPSAFPLPAGYLGVIFVMKMPCIASSIFVAFS